MPQAKLIHPRIEPEIIFVMKDRLAGPGVTRESGHGRRRDGLGRCRGHRLPV